jgi:hypothetical protein
MTHDIMTTATMLRDRAAGLRQRATAAEIRAHVAPGRLAAFSAAFARPADQASDLLAQAVSLDAAAAHLEHGHAILAAARAQLDAIRSAA